MTMMLLLRVGTCTTHYQAYLKGDALALRLREGKFVSQFSISLDDNEYIKTSYIY